MKSRYDWLFVCLLIILPILFHWRILTPNTLDRGSFPQGDFAEQFYAFARFAYDELAQGRLPLWNPYTYAGHPFLADVQSAVFYPPSLLIMFIASFFGGFSLYWLEWQAVLHFSLAGVFTFLFAHHILALENADASSRFTPHASRALHTPLAAFLSAITFAFGGYLTAYPSQQLAVLETDVWLPLILLCISRAVESQAKTSFAIRHSLLAGFFLGIALLAGHPQSALYVLLVSIAFMAFHGRRQNWRWRALILRSLVMLVVALGISAAQWLPSLEFMQLSSRSHLNYTDYARGFELFDPLQMLLPGSVSFYSPLYIGIAPLALIVWGVWHAYHTKTRATRRAITFWLGMAIVALLLSFGGNLFFYPILYLFAPAFNLFRQQERAAFIVSLAMALLAGYGALMLTSALPRDWQRHLRQFARWSVGLLCGALVFFLLTYFAWQNVQLARASPFRAASERAMWLVLMLLLLTSVLWLRVWGRLKRGRWLAVVVVITLLDLFTINWQTNFQPIPPEARTRAPAFLAPLLADTTLFRTFNEYRIFGNFGAPFRIEDTWGASPLRLARYEQFHKLPMERLWALLNVQYVITWRKTLNVPSEIVASEPINEPETTYVHRLFKVSPRAALVSRITVVSSQDETLKLLGSPDFDFTQQAILAAPLATALGDEVGRITFVSRTASSSIWETQASTPLLFVLSENDYPGWRAFVDGQATPIIRANFVMMAVPVPAGNHRIAFVFDPISVKLGFVISVLTLMGMAASWALEWFKPQHPNRPSDQATN